MRELEGGRQRGRGEHWLEEDLLTEARKVNTDLALKICLRPVGSRVGEAGEASVSPLF